MTDERRRHQQHVSALLDEIEERRRRLYALEAYGVRAGGARDLNDELGVLRRELAEAVEMHQS